MTLPGRWGRPASQVNRPATPSHIDVVLPTDETPGAVKDAVGKVTGDTKLQAEGKMDKAKGKVESAVGGTRDAVREARNS